jgi:NAD(P)-dependent dehydrogenase (short-subunit alcohol dehydrogenase family)
MSTKKFPLAGELTGTQSQRPGHEHKMDAKPIFDLEEYKGYDRLKGKVAIITGGDSGIGRAVAVAYAKEGAKVAVAYKNEKRDAEDVAEYMKSKGWNTPLLFEGDIGDPDFCERVVTKTNEHYGKIDILVNNAGEQHPQDSILDISNEQLRQTFATNIFSMFYFVKAALPFMPEGSSIINTSSVTAYKGNPELLDYSSTKGAVTSFTRSLSIQLASKNIRVNQVAPGPIWTPLITSTFDEETVKGFGEGTNFHRPGQPVELAEAYVFLAWDQGSSFISGQTIHINGGSVING